MSGRCHIGGMTSEERRERWRAFWAGWASVFDLGVYVEPPEDDEGPSDLDASIDDIRHASHRAMLELRRSLRE